MSTDCDEHSWVYEDVTSISMPSDTVPGEIHETVVVEQCSDCGAYQLVPLDEPSRGSNGDGGRTIPSDSIDIDAP